MCWKCRLVNEWEKANGCALSQERITYSDLYCAIMWKLFESWWPTMPYHKESRGVDHV